MIINNQWDSLESNCYLKWHIKHKKKNNDSKVGYFIKSTRTNSPTGESGATTLPLIINSFMYIETS